MDIIKKWFFVLTGCGFFVLTGCGAPMDLQLHDTEVLECWKYVFHDRLNLEAVVAMTDDEFHRTYGEYRNQTRQYFVNLSSVHYYDWCRIEIIIFGLDRDGEFFRKYGQYHNQTAIKETMTPEYCEIFFTIYKVITDDEYNLRYEEKRNHPGPVSDANMYCQKYLFGVMTDADYNQKYGFNRNQTILKPTMTPEYCEILFTIWTPKTDDDYNIFYEEDRNHPGPVSDADMYCQKYLFGVMTDADYNRKYGVNRNQKGFEPETTTAEYDRKYGVNRNQTGFEPETKTEDYNRKYGVNRNQKGFEPETTTAEYDRKYGVNRNQTGFEPETKTEDYNRKNSVNRNQKGFEPETTTAEYDRKYGDNRDQTRFSTDPMDDKEFCGKFLNLTAFSLLEEKLIRGKALALQLEELQRSIEQWHLGSMHDSSYFDIRIDELPQTCQQLDIPRNCDEATACTRRSGYYQIKVNGFTNASLPSILVECVIDPDNGTWLIIQRRQDGSIDFYRDWNDYQNGFGDVEGEFFIGLDKLHALTYYQGPQELMIRMENEDGKGVSAAYALYTAFAIGSGDDKYVLKRIGQYSGDAGDSLQAHVGQQFTTKDKDNDNISDNCARRYTGGWWYDKCHYSNLNGQYGDKTPGKGINWHTLSGYNVSLKYVEMMIRRRRQ